MTAPLDSDIRRAVASAALMTSDKDGEALNATRALVRLLQKNGLDPASVVNAGILRSMERPKRSEPEPVDLRTRHQFLARMCLIHLDLLNEWEQNFVRDMVTVRSPSEKQRKRLKIIADKIQEARR